ncbi:MAG: SDR family oxidoreductase [Sphingomonas sp.]
MRIAITGAAGLLGSARADSLVQSGHGVLALVHQNADLVANDGRPLASMAWSGAAAGSGELVTLRADITEPMIGLDPELAAIVGTQIDLVVHAAALTAFEAPWERHQAINVDGTANVIATWPDVPLLYVSTAYVCGEQDGAIAEAPRADGNAFSNGYERSKAAAEALVFSAGAAGRPIAIARPSVVLGTYASGTIRSFDTFYAVFRLLAEGRLSALPAAPGAAIDFVPIDHVIGGLADIISRWDAAQGKVFHLTSGAPVNIMDFHAAMAGVPHFSPPAFLAPEQFDAKALPAIERRIYDRAVRQYMGYFARAPRFATGNVIALSGRVCPPMDTSALHRMIGYAMNRGFLKSA